MAIAEAAKAGKKMVTFQERRHQSQHQITMQCYHRSNPVSVPKMPKRYTIYGTNQGFFTSTFLVGPKWQLV